MSVSFKCGELYKFTEDGEELPVEHSYKEFFRKVSLKKDQFGFYSFMNGDLDLIYIPVLSGTIALYLGSDETKMFTTNIKVIENFKYHKFLIDGQIGILVDKEKNLYSFEKIPVERY